MKANLVVKKDETIIFTVVRMLDCVGLLCSILYESQEYIHLKKYYVQGQ